MISSFLFPRRLAPASPRRPSSPSRGFRFRFRFRFRFLAPRAFRRGFRPRRVRVAALRLPLPRRRLVPVRLLLAARLRSASSGSIAFPVRPFTAFLRRSLRYFANRSLNPEPPFVDAAAAKKLSMRLCRSAFSHSCKTGRSRSSVLARGHPKRSRQNARSMSRSGRPHSRRSFDVSTAGLAYASTTCSDGNEGGRCHPFFTERCCALNATRRGGSATVESSTTTSSSESEGSESESESPFSSSPSSSSSSSSPAPSSPSFSFSPSFRFSGVFFVGARFFFFTFSFFFFFLPPHRRRERFRELDLGAPLAERP